MVGADITNLCFLELGDLKMVCQLFTETPDCPTISRGVEVSSHKGVWGNAPPGSFEMLKLQNTFQCSERKQLQSKMFGKLIVIIMLVYDKR